MATRPPCCVGNPAWLDWHGVETNFYSPTVCFTYQGKPTRSGGHGVSIRGFANDNIRINHQDDLLIDQGNFDIRSTIRASFFQGFTKCLGDFLKILRSECISFLPELTRLSRVNFSVLFTVYV